MDGTANQALDIIEIFLKEWKRGHSMVLIGQVEKLVEVMRTDMPRLEREDFPELKKYLKRLKG